MSAKNRFLNSVSGFAITAALTGLALPALADNDQAVGHVTPFLASLGVTATSVQFVEAESNDPVNTVNVEGIVYSSSTDNHATATGVLVYGWDIESSGAYDFTSGQNAIALAQNIITVSGAVSGTIGNEAFAPGTGSYGVLVNDDIQAKDALAEVSSSGDGSGNQYNTTVSAVAENTISAAGSVGGSAIDSYGIRVDGNVEAFNATAQLTIDNYYGPDNIAIGTARALNIVGVQGVVGGNGASDGSTGFYVAGSVYAADAAIEHDGYFSFDIPEVGIFNTIPGATVYTTGIASLDAVAGNSVSLSGSVVGSGGDGAVGFYVGQSVYAQQATAEGQALSDGGQFETSGAFAGLRAENSVIVTGLVSGSGGPATGVEIEGYVFAQGATAEGQAIARYADFYDGIGGDLTRAEVIVQASNAVALSGIVTGGSGGTGVSVGEGVYAQGALAEGFAGAAPYGFDSEDVETNTKANAIAEATNSVTIFGSVGVSESTGVQIVGNVYAREAYSDAVATSRAQFLSVGEGIPSAVAADASVTSSATNAVVIAGVVGETLTNAHGVDPAYVFASEAYASDSAYASAYSIGGAGATANASADAGALNTVTVAGTIGAGSTLSSGVGVDFDVYASNAYADGYAEAYATQINNNTIDALGATATATNLVTASNEATAFASLGNGVQSSTGIYIGAELYAYDAFASRSSAFAEAAVTGGELANALAQADNSVIAGNSVGAIATIGDGSTGVTGIYVGEEIYAYDASASGSAFAQATNFGSAGSATAEAGNAIGAHNGATVVGLLGNEIVDSVGIVVEGGDGIYAGSAYASGDARAQAYLTQATSTLSTANAEATNAVQADNEVTVLGTLGNAAEGSTGVLVNGGYVQAYEAFAEGYASAYASVSEGNGNAIAGASNSVSASNAVGVTGGYLDDALGSVGVWIAEGGVVAGGAFAEGNANAEAYNNGSTGGTSTATASNSVAASNGVAVIGNVGNNAQFADGVYADGVYIAEGVLAVDAFAEGSAQAIAVTGPAGTEGPVTATVGNDVSASNSVAILGTVGNLAEGAAGVYVDGVTYAGVPFLGPVPMGASAINAFAEGSALATADNSGGTGGADATAVNNVDAANSVFISGSVGAEGGDVVGVGIDEGFVVAAFAEANGYTSAYAHGQTASATAQAGGTISASNGVVIHGAVGDASVDSTGAYIGESVIAGAALAEGSFYASANTAGGDASALIGTSEAPASVTANNAAIISGQVSGINGAEGGWQYNDGVYIGGSVVAIGALAEGNFSANSYRNAANDGSAIATIFGDVSASNVVAISGTITPGSSAEGAFAGEGSTGVFIGGDVAALGAAAFGSAGTSTSRSGGDEGEATASTSLATSALNAVQITGDVGSYNNDGYGVFIGEGVTAAGALAEGYASAYASNNGIGEAGGATATATSGASAVNQVVINGSVGVSNSFAQYSTGVYIGEGVTAALAIAEGSAYAEASQSGDGLGNATATANNEVEATNLIIISGTVGDNINDYSTGVGIGGGVSATEAFAEGSAFAEASKSGPEGIAIATASDTVTAANVVSIGGTVGVDSWWSAGVDPAYVNASNATATSSAGVYVNGPVNSTGTATSTAQASNIAALSGTVSEDHFENVGVWVGGNVTAENASATAGTSVTTAGLATGTGSATAAALNEVSINGIVGPEGSYSTGVYIGGEVRVGGLFVGLDSFSTTDAGTTVASTGTGTMYNLVTISGGVGENAFASDGVYIGEGIQFSGDVNTNLSAGFGGSGVATALQVVEGLNVAAITGSVGPNSSESHGVWIGGNIEVTNTLASNFVIIGYDETNDGTTRGVYIGGSILTGDALNSQVDHNTESQNTPSLLVPDPNQIGDYVELAGSVFIGANGGLNPYGVAVGGGNDTVLVRDTHFQMEVVNGFDGGSNPDADGQDRITFNNAKIFVSNLDNFELANVTNHSMVILTNPSPYTYAVRDEVNVDIQSILSFGDGGAPPPFPIANGAPVNALTLTTEMLTIGGVAGVKTPGPGIDDSILKAENNGTGSYVINAENGVYNFGTITLSKVLSTIRGTDPHGLLSPSATSFDEAAEQQYWAVTGSWNIDPTSGAGDYLTINGNYTAGSDIIVDAFVFKSTSPADVVEINGNVAGLTTVWVNNINTTGVGAFTGNGPNDGILLIDVNNAQDPNVVGQAFVLGNTSGWNWADPVNFPVPEMQVGAFVYTLNQGGPDNRNFYLRSQLLDQVPAYTVMTSAIQQHFYGELGTLYQRMGELRHADYGSKQNTSFFEFWGRAWGQDLQMNPKEGFDFDMKSVGFMIGGDYAIRNWIAPQSRLHLGVFGGWGKTTLDNIDGPVGNSDGKTDGYTVGVYATYHDTAKKGRGLYIDAVGKVNWLDSEYWSNTRHTRAKSDDFAWGASLEAGYGIGLGGNFILQPQGQISYMQVDKEKFTESKTPGIPLEVERDAADSLRGRLGVQLQNTWTTSGGTQFSPYIIGNVLHEFMGDNKTTVSGTEFTNDMGGTWFNAGAGFTVDFDNVGLYGHVEYNFGGRVEGLAAGLGVKVRLGGTSPVAPAAAAPAPAPAVAPKKNYIVFFDFDRSNITADAARVIDEASSAAKTGNTARVQLTGHADRSGSEQYNMALSMRRAEAVKREMIARGVPANSIFIIARGETQPLVPTADGVREPQNRRVEIML